MNNNKPFFHNMALIFENNIEIKMKQKETRNKTN